MPDCLSDISVWDQIPIPATEIIELIPDFVGIANSEGHLLFVNRAGRRMLGLGANEDLSRYLIHDFFPRWTIASLEGGGNGNGNGDGVHDAIRKTEWNQDGRLRNRDGHEVPVAHAVIAHTNGDSEIACFTILARGAFDASDDDSSVHRIYIDATIDKSIAVARASLPQSIAIEESLKCADSAVLADPTQIHQMVMNLCLNSAQSMRGGGGQIFINTRRVAVKGPNEPGGTALRAGDYVRLTIRDNGPGLEPSVATHVFEPALDRSNGNGSTSYGLWNVKRTVINSGGDIFVETAPGRGTAFHVYLPFLGMNGSNLGP